MKQGEAANFAFIEPMKALPVMDLPVGDWPTEIRLIILAIGSFVPARH